MIAVYYNRITLRKKLYRKSCHSVCAVPQSQISRKRYVQKYGRAREPDTAHMALSTLIYNFKILIYQKLFQFSFSCLKVLNLYCNTNKLAELQSHNSQ